MAARCFCGAKYRTSPSTYSALSGSAFAQPVSYSAVESLSKERRAGKPAFHAWYSFRESRVVILDVCQILQVRRMCRVSGTAFFCRTGKQDAEGGGRSEIVPGEGRKCANPSPARVVDVEAWVLDP